MVGLCWEWLSFPSSLGAAVRTFALTLAGSHLESQAVALLVRPGLVCWCFLPLDLVLDRGAEPRLPGLGQGLWPWDFPVVPYVVHVCLCKIHFWAHGFFSSSLLLRKNFPVLSLDAGSTEPTCLCKRVFWKSSLFR